MKTNIVVAIVVAISLLTACAETEAPSTSQQCQAICEGQTGPQGPQGPQGEKGEKGDRGQGTETVVDLEPVVQATMQLAKRSATSPGMATITLPEDVPDGVKAVYLEVGVCHDRTVGMAEAVMLRSGDSPARKLTYRLDDRWGDCLRDEQIQTVWLPVSGREVTVDTDIGSAAVLSIRIKALGYIRDL